MAVFEIHNMLAIRWAYSLYRSRSYVFILLLSRVFPLSQNPKLFSDNIKGEYDTILQGFKGNSVVEEG